MKRLCVFYRLSWLWMGENVEWIVCKECQRRLKNSWFKAAIDGGPCGRPTRRKTDKSTFNRDMQKA